MARVINKNQKNILVSFSGGLDSTYLVYKNLKEGHKVTGIYTKILNNKIKIDVELQQSNQITELFQKEFPDQFTLEQGIDIMVYGYCDLYLKQIMIWIMSSLYHGSKYDEVHIGAVMNDDLISYIPDVKKTWKSFEFLSQDLPKLRFPLSKLPKWEIVEQLPLQYKELVVYCEDPKIIKRIGGKNPRIIFENCGHCNPCSRYQYESKKWNYEYGQIGLNKKEDEPIPDIESMESESTVYAKD